MKLLALCILLAASSCGPIGPGPEVPECVAGTRAIVCHHPGFATCGEADSLEAVVGCYVQATATVKLECVGHCD